MTIDRIVDKDGWLFVVMEMTDWEKPILRRLYYPIGIKTQYHPDLVGQEATYHDGGVYRVEDGTRLELLSGGFAVPDVRYTENIPLKPPRGKRVRWTAGGWERYDFKNGWHRV